MFFHFINFSIQQSEQVFKLTTDSLVLAGLTELKGDEKVLDVGTGTGVIALLLKDRYPEIQIDAIDISSEAVELANLNFMAFPHPAGLKVFKGSIDSVAEKEYDLIISNPPYFKDSLTSPQEWKTKARHTADWDWKIFFQESKRRLTPEGRITLILPYPALEGIRGLANKSNLYLTRLTEISDQDHSPTKLVHLEFQKMASSYTKDHLVLKDEDGSFSDEYKGLLKGWVVW